jgi:hypothetical protein
MDVEFLTYCSFCEICLLDTILYKPCRSGYCLLDCPCCVSCSEDLNRRCALCRRWNPGMNIKKKYDILDLFQDY